MKKLILIVFVLFSAVSYAQYYHTDFESQPVGTAYTRPYWQADGFRTATWDQGLETRTMIDNSTSVSGTKSLRVTYPANTFGPDINGFQLPLLVDPVDELYMSYWICFSENFTWGTTNYGGKVPGIAGGDNCSGGEYCVGTNGFSCRFMWRTGGKIGLYLYDMTKECFYGEDHELLHENGSNVYFVPGQWLHIAERVKINSSSSSSDGEVEVWVNGEQVLLLKNRKFVTNDDKCDKLYLSSFHGGDDNTWCPKETCYIWYDDIKISTKKSDVEFTYCTKPNLGIDRTLCGESSIELNSQITNTSTVCTWTKDGVVVGTGTTLNVSTPGTYIVNADSLGCTRKDTILVSSNLQPNLGDDIHLCEQAYATLQANVVGKNVSYAWYKNNVLLSNEKNQSLLTKDAGTYMVTVSSESCVSASDEIMISSGLIDIPDVESEPNKSVMLSIQNPEETIYDWYDSQKEGTIVNSGNSFTTNSGTITKTYFVEDRNGLSTLVGKPKLIVDNSYTEYRYERRMKFEVFKNLTIDSITINLVGEQNVVINILDDSEQIKITKTFENLGAGDQRICLAIDLEPGIYYMSAEGSTGRLRYSNELDTDIHFPYTIDSVISLLGSNVDWIDNKPYYLFFYNWRVSTGNHCARTPVSVVVGSISEESTQTIQLKKGWNLMSFNLHPSDSSITTLFADLQVDIVKNNEGFWKQAYSIELQSLTSMTAGEGYLVYMNESGTFTVSGKMMSNTTIEKQSGWNLIGCPFQTETPIESIYDANNCEMLISLDGKWQPAGTNNSLQKLKPGEGYFIK